MFLGLFPTALFEQQFRDPKARHVRRRAGTLDGSKQKRHGLVIGMVRQQDNALKIGPARLVRIEMFRPGETGHGFGTKSRGEQYFPQPTPVRPRLRRGTHPRFGALDHAGCRGIQLPQRDDRRLRTWLGAEEQPGTESDAAGQGQQQGQKESMEQTTRHESSTPWDIDAADRRRRRSEVPCSARILTTPSPIWKRREANFMGERGCVSAPRTNVIGFAASAAERCCEHSREKETKRTREGKKDLGKARRASTAEVAMLACHRRTQKLPGLITAPSLMPHSDSKIVSCTL